MLEPVIGALLTGGVRMLTGAQSQWAGCAPSDTQRIYFANHCSHLDFVLLWSALPAKLRRTTRPVAAADYWRRTPMRRYIINRVYRGVLVDRAIVDWTHSPLQPMINALDGRDSLIVFPEGTRGEGEQLMAFRPGIYHLAKARPEVELVPVWMENLYRVMPKGSFLPVPLLCSVIFGKPTRIEPGEDRETFLHRLHGSLLDLRCP